MSSSSSSQFDDLEGALEMCHCNAVVKMRESGTPGNPARRFVNCAKSLMGRDACNFFRWLDQPLIKHYRDTINRLKALSDGSEVQKLELNLEQVEASLAHQKKIMVKEKLVAARKTAELQVEVSRVRKALKLVLLVAAIVVVEFVVGFK